MNYIEFDNGTSVEIIRVIEDGVREDIIHKNVASMTIIRQPQLNCFIAETEMSQNCNGAGTIYYNDSMIRFSSCKIMSKDPFLLNLTKETP